MTASAYTVPEGFQDGYVDAAGLRLHYWRRGRGRPLLVLHGVTDWGLDWARFARRVEDQLDCVLLDQRGHGHSDGPERGYAYADFADDAWQVIEQLGLERPAVLGHSLGGGSALALAARHPEALDRLLLVDPAIRIDPEQQRDAGDAERHRADVSRRRAALEETQRLGRAALRERVRRAHPTWDAEDISNTVESTLLARPGVWDENRRPDYAAQEAQLQHVRCPTLVVRGEPERGAIITDAIAARIAALVPGGLARVTTIAGTGHVPQRDAFDLFVAVVLPFLTGETAPPAEGGAPACFAHLLDESGALRD